MTDPSSAENTGPGKLITRLVLRDHDGKRFVVAIPADATPFEAACFVALISENDRRHLLPTGWSLKGAFKYYYLERFLIEEDKL
jgi:hypothetical protein